MSTESKVRIEVQKIAAKHNIDLTKTESRMIIHRWLEYEKTRQHGAEKLRLVSSVCRVSSYRVLCDVTSALGATNVPRHCKNAMELGDEELMKKFRSKGAFIPWLSDKGGKAKTTRGFENLVAAVCDLGLWGGQLEGPQSAPGYP